MQLQINLTIPPWTKWVTAGVLVGVVLDVGASRVYADAVAVKTARINAGPGLRR